MVEIASKKAKILGDGYGIEEVRTEREQSKSEGGEQAHGVGKGTVQ